MDSKTIRLNTIVDKKSSTHVILREVYDAMEEKGYHPIDQIVGFLISGDPSYIPRSGNARNNIRQIPREQMLEEILRYYLEEHE